MIQQYIQYFKDVAVTHPDIRHRDETGGVAFDFVEQKQIKELTISRTAINADANCILIAVIPTLEGRLSSDALLQRNVTAAFFLLQKYNGRVKDRLAKQPIFDECELIANDILYHISESSCKRHPLFCRSVDNIGNLNARWIEQSIDENWIGFLITFNFVHKLSETSSRRVKWLDGGPKRYPL
jgi:hypothetical protein